MTSATLIILIAGAFVLLAFVMWWRQSQNSPHKTVSTPKKKQAQFPPLNLTIEDTWVKCQIERERGTTARPISQLQFQFFDANDNQVYADNYGSDKAMSYDRQLYKLLTAHGFERHENKQYREWATTIYIRTPESSASS